MSANPELPIADGPAPRLHDNLKRLCAGLSACIQSPALRQSVESQNIANHLPLSHSTSTANVQAICSSGYLKSMAALIEEGVLKHRPECAEVALCTTNAVFFYVGPFAYPATTFGFLFSQTLETANHSEGSATPFDSGGLLRNFSWSTKQTESPLQFFDRHELPIPDHREYLELVINSLYPRPIDYLDPSAVVLKANPIGLEGGDATRRRTHEVRIPGKVKLRSTDLRAVFAPRNRIAAQSEIRDLYLWCGQNGVDRRFFDSPGGDDFSGLRSACLDYLEKLY
jgi:hypothetical protein